MKGVLRGRMGMECIIFINILRFYLIQKYSLVRCLGWEISRLGNWSL